MPARRWTLPIAFLLSLILLPAILLALAISITYPTLPALDALVDYRPKVPLRIYSADGEQIGEFGEERRAVVKIEEVPADLRRAFLAAEDDRFYQHNGVDYQGVLRAAISNFTSGGVRQGASTITMQVARNFFLSKEKTLTRKFNEVLLAFKIEHNLSKDQILELYVNQIYLGQRAYGVAAAAQIYFSKSLSQLTLAETAMLAGLPKAPSAYNPVVNPKRAKLRQQYVLRRMFELRYIDEAQYQLALQQPIITRTSHGRSFHVHAEYMAEMARQAVYDLYQDEAYTQGIRVYTTLLSSDQQAAYLAVRNGVADYDHRHGYRGPERTLPPGSDEAALEQALSDAGELGDMIPAIVLAASPKKVHVYLKGGKQAELSGKALDFATRALSKNASAKQRITPGALIRLAPAQDGNWQISQVPQVEAAFVSADPRNGAVRALVGGYDFNLSQFNHITLSWRQPGSSLKPFIYSSALEKGFTPATLINDAPMMFDAEQTGSGEAWQPKNYDGKFEGPMRMREALTKSKNLVSIRILQAISPQYARDFLTKFGFDADKHPPYLTMALGAGSVTPMQLLGGYTVFANGGFRVPPYFIERIEDADGRVLFQALPAKPGEGAQQVIDVRNAFTMVNMLQDVVKHGTARKALDLGRQDLAGKTGTTSDSIDAWFCGFQPTLVGIAWMGFDQPRSLGDHETGGGAALPIWMDYMRSALENVPEAVYPMPDNMVTTRINNNGFRDPGGTADEYFYAENVPGAAPPSQPQSDEPSPLQQESIKDQLL